MKIFSFCERKAGYRPVARDKRSGRNSELMRLVAPVLHSRLSCAALVALALAEFIDAYRPALQLLGLRAGSPKEEPATLDAEIFFLGTQSRKSTGSERQAH